MQMGLGYILIVVGLIMIVASVLKWMGLIKNTHVGREHRLGLPNKTPRARELGRSGRTDPHLRRAQDDWGPASTDRMTAAT